MESSACPKEKASYLVEVTGQGTVDQVAEPLVQPREEDSEQRVESSGRASSSDRTAGLHDVPREPTSDCASR